MNSSSSPRRSATQGDTDAEDSMRQSTNFKRNHEVSKTIAMNYFREKNEFKENHVRARTADPKSRSMFNSNMNKSKDKLEDLSQKNDMKLKIKENLVSIKINVIYLQSLVVN